MGQGGGYPHGLSRYPRRMASPLTEQLAGRVRALLRRADHPTGGAGSAAQWRAQRDRWLDELDPRHASDFDESDIRRLIDFLAESGPSASSRASRSEWSADVDELTPELLFSTS
jgi:hypothetical protein